MSNSVEGFNTSGWNKLANQTPQISQLESLKADLPAIAPASKAWVALKQTPEIRAAYTSQLLESTQGIQQFIAQHAAPGPERREALSNLNDFIQTRINCNPDKLSPLVINETRRNLNLFVRQLENPNIDDTQKLSCALALAQGMGVCNEGETLNILECTQNLCTQQTGMAGVLTRVKNKLVEQTLLQLVKHEDTPRLHPNLAKELEIHHVQALKNQVADQWGLAVIEDRYATANYQIQAGRMAEELLKQTITPATLANTVAEQIAQAFCDLSGQNLTEGVPTERLKTEPLRRAIQAEFGQGIELEDYLEFNDDYTSVRLKPQPELAKQIMGNCQLLGLIPPHSNLDGLLNEKPVNIAECIQQLNSLRGQPQASNYSPSPLLHSFWFGATKLIAPQKKQSEEDQNKFLMATLRRLDIQA